jgi:hypothetical protein
MKSRYRAALVAVAAVCAVSALTASAAFAAPEWYSSTTPTTIEWQQSGTRLSEAAPTSWKGTIKLGDAESESTVECDESAEGTAGPGDAGTVTKVTVSSCVILKAGVCVRREEIKEVKAMDLPWHTELVNSKETKRDLISEDGKGVPGFQFTCYTELGTFTNKCSGSEKTLNPIVEGVGSGVDARFADEQLNCSGESGSLEGTQLIEATKGSKLEANDVEGAFSKLTSALAVKDTGELTLEDKGLGAGTACDFETEGKLEPAGKGTITNTYASNCKNVGDDCELRGGITAINLPWDTELYESEGTLRDRIVSGGNGTPGWGFECNRSDYGPVTDHCSLNVSPEVLNGFEGSAFAVFDERTTKTTCSWDTREGEAVWKGELKIVPTGGGAIKAKK